MEEHFHARFFALRAVRICTASSGRKVKQVQQAGPAKPFFRPAVQKIGSPSGRAPHFRQRRTPHGGFRAAPRAAWRAASRCYDMCRNIGLHNVRRVRHILPVECRRYFSIYFEKLYLSTAIIGLCQQKTRAIRQKSHCSRIPDMVKYPRKTGETSDSAES